jgi:molybdate transport system regulatory protein
VANPALEALLTVQRNTATRMGAERRRLLEAVREHGSISAAARAAGLSYKAAWDAVNAMNNLFGRPLVEARPGGRGGGGAAVTPAGHQVLSVFTVLEAELGHCLERLQHHLGDADGTFDPALLWSLLMKTSARNMLRCTVREVIDGAVNAEILLDLADGQHLTAIITRQSVRELGLAPGKDVFALVKSSFVILAPEHGIGKTSARNRLCGTVAARDDGAVNSEFTIDIGGGKSLVAIVTLQSARSLGLQKGDRACALIKASNVILAV